MLARLLCGPSTSGRGGAREQETPDGVAGGRWSGAAAAGDLTDPDAKKRDTPRDGTGRVHRDACTVCYNRGVSMFSGRCPKLEELYAPPPGPAHSNATR